MWGPSNLTQCIKVHLKMISVFLEGTPLSKGDVDPNVIVMLVTTLFPAWLILRP
jgi:hypothetical protein